MPTLEWGQDAAAGRTKAPAPTNDVSRAFLIARLVYRTTCGPSAEFGGRIYTNVTGTSRNPQE